VQPNRFITFEGGEGSGKSTQVGLLAERLRALRQAVVVTREPGGSPLAEQIRELILAHETTDPVAECLLFAAARAEHMTTTINPAVQAGTWVICDRFVDSTRVYQGEIRHVGADLIRQLEQSTVGSHMPGLTLVLDLPVDVAMMRASERGVLSRFDAQRRETHEMIRNGFLRIAAAEPHRCVVVDAGADPSAVAAAIWDVVRGRFQIGAA
jgi:dTMP kinase